MYPVRSDVTNKNYSPVRYTQGCQVGLLRPNFRNLALFQVGWPINCLFQLEICSFSGFVSNWLALTNSFCLLDFTLKKCRLSKYIYYSIVFGKTYVKLL